jgi:nitrate reductase gamma subunit
MDFLDLVRGPLLWLSIAVFLLCVLWQLYSLWRMPSGRAPTAPARQAFGKAAALRSALGRTVPKGGFHPSATLVTINPYVFHLGLTVVVFGYAPHIAFVQKLTGLWWPALPDMAMYIAAALTIISLLLALLFRLTDSVLKRISKADDFITWTVTFLPVITGMAVLNESSAVTLLRDHVLDRGPLALHLFSLELLLMWFPFGKLMHAFWVLPARMQLATFLGRRGVRS